VAIVATDVGGTREVFPASSDAALIVPPGDDAALAEALSTLLTDWALRQQLGSAARQRAEQAFILADAAAGLARHYHEVLSRK
jgi:glycosyltransferase involved in cell wall biosynthesis